MGQFAFIVDLLMLNKYPFGMIKTIEGTNGLYEIDSDGVIYSKHFGRTKTLTQCDHPSGYKIVCLAINKKHKHTLVHRAVAMTFIENPNNLAEVNHKDGNKHNNIVSNLEWVSRRENIRHAVENGLTRTGNKKRKRKVSDEQISDIVKMYNSGFHVADISLKYSISVSMVYLYVRGYRC